MIKVGESGYRYLDVLEGADIKAKEKKEQVGIETSDVFSKIDFFVTMNLIEEVKYCWNFRIVRLGFEAN